VGLSKAARSTIKTYGHPSSGRVSSEAGETKKGVPWKTTWLLGFTETQGTGDSGLVKSTSGRRPPRESKKKILIYN
jgi:hypothetical protein